MAIIGKIRERSWLLLIVVGGAIVTFIFTSQGPNFGDGSEEEYGIGLVYGEKVDQQKFNSKLREAEEVAEQNAQRSQQPKQPVNQDQVWNQFVEEELLEKEFQALGIVVSEDEFNAYLYGRSGFAPPADLANTFKDEAGNFDAKALEQQINQLKNSKDPEMKKAWERSKEYYMMQRQRQKYFDILEQGIYVTKLEAKRDYLARNEKKSVEFVVLNYNKIEDKSIKVDDKKLKAYFKANKNDPKYKNRSSEHVIRWADIKIAPSKEDSMTFDKEIAKLKRELKITRKDSLFVMANATSKNYSSKLGYRPEGSKNSFASRGITYPADMDSTFRNAQIGDVIGPYVQAGATRIAKVTGKGPLLSVRHILINATRADSLAVDKAKVVRDSLMKIVNSSNFEELAMKHSGDHQEGQPVANGGKYEDFISGEMVPEFEEFAKDQPVGKIGYVQTDFGFHIIEVLGREENVVPTLAIVDKVLTPGAKTLSKLEGDAYSILDKMYKKVGAIKDPYKKVAMFDTIAQRKDMVVRLLNVRDDSPSINGFTSAYAESELFKLAYKSGAKVGDLISSPLKDGDRWVVAILADIRVKGKVNFENSRRLVETEYIQDRKYKMLRAKMEGKSLKAIEEAENVLRQAAEVVFSESTIGRISSEPLVVGALFSGLKDGAMTHPIKGTAGVYVIKIGKSMPAPVSADYTTERNQMLAQRRGRIQAGALNALKDMAEILDNRKFYEINIRR